MINNMHLGPPMCLKTAVMLRSSIERMTPTPHSRQYVKNPFFVIITYMMKIFEKFYIYPREVMALLIDCNFILRLDTRWLQKSPKTIEAFLHKVNVLVNS